MKTIYSKFGSIWLSQRESVKALIMIALGAIFGYFAEIYNDVDFTHIGNFDFIQAAINAFNDWRAIINKMILAFFLYYSSTIPRNSKGEYFKKEPPKSE